MPVLFEEAGGILEPEKMIAAHVDVARHHGATVRTGEQVRALLLVTGRDSDLADMQSAAC